MRSLACTTAAALLAAGLANSAEARVLYHWVELGDGETATVRAVTDGACPNVTFDGIATPMAKRSGAAMRFQNVKAASFNVTGCEVIVPRGVKAAVIDGNPVELPLPDLRRIVVLGDTGCRIAKGER